MLEKGERKFNLLELKLWW